MFYVTHEGALRRKQTVKSHIYDLTDYKNQNIFYAINKIIYKNEPLFRISTGRLWRLKCWAWETISNLHWKTNGTFSYFLLKTHRKTSTTRYRKTEKERDFLKILASRSFFATKYSKSYFASSNSHIRLW